MYVSIYQSINLSICLYFYLSIYVRQKSSLYPHKSVQPPNRHLPMRCASSPLVCQLVVMFVGRFVCWLVSGSVLFFKTGWMLHFHAPIWAHLFCNELATLQLQRRWIENVGSTFCLDISRWSSNDFGTSCRNDFINRLIGSWYFYPNVSGNMIL